MNELEYKQQIEQDMLTRPSLRMPKEVEHKVSLWEKIKYWLRRKFNG